MFKKHNFKIFWCNPNDPNFNLFKIVDEINWHISREKKPTNEVINKVDEDFEKIVAIAKSK